MEASVYRDFEGNRAAVKIFDKGSDRKYIYSYATNEIFKMSGEQDSFNLYHSLDKFMIFSYFTQKTDFDLYENCLLRGFWSTRTLVNSYLSQLVPTFGQLVP